MCCSNFEVMNLSTMKSKLSCTILVLLSVSIVSEQSRVITMHNDDKGGFKNCGPKEIDFVLQWTPAVLKTGADFYFDIALKLFKSFDHGQVCVTVYLKGVPDPIYQDCNTNSCEDLRNFVKSYLPSLPCPLPAGFGYHVSNYKVNIPPTVPLPSGEFNVTATVKNQDGILILCATGDIQVDDGDY